MPASGWSCCWRCAGRRRRRRRLAQQPAGRAGRSRAAELAQQDPRRASADELRATPIQGIYEFTRGTRHRLRHAPTASTPSTATCRARQERQPHRAAPARAARADARRVPRERHADFRAQGCRSTRSRCSPTSTVAYCRKLHSQIAEYNRLGHPRALPALPAHRPEHPLLDQGRTGVVLRRPQRCAHPREARSGAQDQALHRQPGGALLRTRSGLRARRERRPSCMADGEMLPRLPAARRAAQASAGAQEPRTATAQQRDGVLASAPAA